MNKTRKKFKTQWNGQYFHSADWKLLFLQLLDSHKGTLSVSTTSKELSSEQSIQWTSHYIFLKEHYRWDSLLIYRKTGIMGNLWCMENLSQKFTRSGPDACWSWIKGQERTTLQSSLSSGTTKHSKPHYSFLNTSSLNLEIKEESSHSNLQLYIKVM